MVTLDALGKGLEAQSYDLLVVGSGAAGMACALSARSLGLRPLLLEASETLGGTTAVSGGVLWVPTNDRLTELGVDDDLDVAIAYVERLAQGRANRAQIASWLTNAPKMVRDLERWLGTRFLALPTYPDYQPEQPGGMTGGRSLDNELFDTRTLGEHRERLRRNPITGRVPITIGEAMGWGVFHAPFAMPYNEVSQRAKDGWVHGGAALIGRMLGAYLAQGGEYVCGVRLVDWAEERSITLESAGEVLAFEGAVPPVVLACGGFEWDSSRSQSLLRGVDVKPASPPSLRGDALSIALRAGAEVANLSEAWWVPVVEIPGERYDDAPLWRSEFSIRCLPHSIIVNSDGRRFVNEALNYNDVVKPFFDFDPVAYRAKNTPAWVVVDGNYLEKYVFLAATPGRPIPDWIAHDDTLEGLAQKCGIDPAGLLDEVARFNGFAEAGVDADFHRGEGAFERFYGDPREEKNPNLGVLSKPPYAALRVYPGAMGTKGGLVVDEVGRVRSARREGGVLQGLFAAGNSMASPAGAGYPGAGSTISIAMTFGWLAAHEIARAKSKA